MCNIIIIITCPAHKKTSLFFEIEQFESRCRRSRIFWHTASNISACCRQHGIRSFAVHSMESYGIDNSVGLYIWIKIRKKKNKKSRISHFYINFTIHVSCVNIAELYDITGNKWNSRIMNFECQCTQLVSLAANTCSICFRCRYFVHRSPSKYGLRIQLEIRFLVFNLSYNTFDSIEAHGSYKLHEMSMHVASKNLMAICNNDEYRRWRLLLLLEFQQMNFPTSASKCR